MSLTLSTLNTHYGQAHILRDVSLSLKQGEVVALLGRNGAGKSTTLKAIIGTVPATSGRIMYKGVDLRGLKNYQRARLGLGYVPEERRIFRRLSVVENLQTGARAKRHKAGNKWTLARVFELFPKLDELRNQAGGQLSGGEQQMLTLARTLMSNPDCLLLDEPTEGLAPVIVDQVMRAIQHLKDEGLSILISEQNRSLARLLATSVCVLEKGQIIYEGSLEAMPPDAHQALGW